MSAIEIELHVPSLEKIESFYEAFGFAVELIDHRAASSYMIATLDGSSIRFYSSDHQHEFFDGTAVPGRGVEIVINVADVDRAHEVAKALDVVVAPLQMRPWGLCDFRVRDPYGFYLRFTEPHDVTDLEYGGRQNA